MASCPWHPDEREYLEALADRRDWIEIAEQHFPHRTRAALRGMMQKVRIEAGMSDQRFVDAPWMANAAVGSRLLLQAQLEARAFPR